MKQYFSDKVMQRHFESLMKDKSNKIHYRLAIKKTIARFAEYDGYQTNANS